MPKTNAGFGFGQSINLNESWEHLAAAGRQFRTSEPGRPLSFALRAATLRYAKDLINRILSTKIVAGYSALNSAAMNLMGSPRKNLLAGRGAFARMADGAMLGTRRQQIDLTA